MNYKISYLIIAAALTFSTASQAAVSAAEAEKLKSTLTPVGAERAGNADGSIPAWDGGYTETDPAFEPGKPGSKRKDFFADEKPLYSVTSANMDQYADQLAEGVKALLKKHADFRVDVYPTHRTAAFPQTIIDGTYKNATSAKLADEGLGIEDAGNLADGFPFPIPKNGPEVIWNHLSRWDGKTMQYTSNCWLVTPNGNLRLSSSGEQIKRSILHDDQSDPSYDGYLLLGRYVQSAPPSKAGESIMVQDTLNYETTEYGIWQYLVGQRRVRRAPSVSYDTPDTVTSGVGFFDEAFMLFGPWDQHEFKLIGKKEMIIPYNANKATAADSKELMGSKFLNPDLVRWEKHRVWVVEATLKPGKRHVVAKRRFYVDEDSWQIILFDGWDANDQLWRMSYTLPLLAPDIPAIIGFVNWGTYNLQEGGYYINGSPIGADSIQPWQNPNINTDMFTPEALAEIGAR